MPFRVSSILFMRRNIVFISLTRGFNFNSHKVDAKLCNISHCPLKLVFNLSLLQLFSGTYTCYCIFVCHIVKNMYSVFRNKLYTSCTQSTRNGGRQWAIVRRQPLRRTSVASFQRLTCIRTTWQRALGFPCLASMQFGYQLTSRILCMLFLPLFFSFGTAGGWAVKWAGEYFHIHMNVKVALKMFLRPCNNSKRVKNEMNRQKKM